MYEWLRAGFPQREPHNAPELAAHHDGRVCDDGRKGAPGRIRLKKEGVIQGDELDSKVAEILKKP